MDRSRWSEASAAALTSAWRHLRLLSCDIKSTQVALKTSTFFVPASVQIKRQPVYYSLFFLYAANKRTASFFSLWGSVLEPSWNRAIDDQGVFGLVPLGFWR